MALIQHNDQTVGFNKTFKLNKTLIIIDNIDIQMIPYKKYIDSHRTGAEVIFDDNPPAEI